MNRFRRAAVFSILLLVLLFSACNPKTDPYSSYGSYSDLIKFKDDAQTNAEVTAGDLAKLKFQDADGKEVSLQQYRDQKNIVLVITRGYVGSADSPAPGMGTFCTYCSTQASRLIANYSDFQKRDAEVLLVFPVARAEDSSKAAEFAARAQGHRSGEGQLPFPLVLDLELSAVEQLGIRDDLSKPATYILDKHGEVRFAYVGQSLSDRPSVKSMLSQLDAINQK